MAKRAEKRRKRSRARRRTAAASSPGARPSQPQRAPSRREAAERPAAPWGSFPLSELAILVGAILLVIGFLSSGPRQVTMIVAGFAVASIGALEVTLREHLAGYRSHTLLLAGVPAVVTLGLLFYLGPESLVPPVRVLIGAAVYGVAAWGLVRLFQARSGGRAFRLKAPRRR